MLSRKIQRNVTISLWLLSLVGAFVFGGKNASSQDKKAVTDDQLGNIVLSTQARGTLGNRGSRNRDSTSSVRGGKYNGPTITEIIQQNDEFSRLKNLLTLIDQLEIEDFAQVFDDLRGSDLLYDRRSEYELFLNAWASIDPVSALDLALVNPTLMNEDQIILQVWTRDDPDGAIAWNEQNSSEEKVDQRSYTIVRVLAKTDPGRAAQIMAGMKDPSAISSAFIVISPLIATKGFEAASSWFGDVSPKPMVKELFARELTTELAKIDPKKTAEWVRSLSDNLFRLDAAGELASFWSKRDLPNTLAWIDTIEGPDRIAAAGDVLDTYAKKDAFEAANFIKSMAGEPGYESVLSKFISATRRSEPALAASQIAQFSDKKSQSAFYRFVLGEWLSSDPQAAEAWINSNEFPDEIRNQLSGN